MASKPTHPMSIHDRAKQFAPFAALRGLNEALKAKEKIVVEKKELSPELAEILDQKFHLIKVKDIITVVYYHDGEYIKLTGMVSKIDSFARFIQIVNTRIDFDDIYDVE
ncbi:MAG: YolD-like family protein [Lachnospiraceae bacterium]|nr:YolD-like family protein [Lachnospiraceae bacterium]